MNFFKSLKNYVFSSSEEKDEPTEFYKLIDERRAVLDRVRQLESEKESIGVNDSMLKKDQIEYINEQMTVLLKYAKVITKRIEIHIGPLSEALGVESRPHFTNKD